MGSKPTRYGAETFLAALLLLWILFGIIQLTGCGKANRYGSSTRRPNLVWNTLSLHLHDGLSKTGFAKHLPEWLQWLKLVDQLTRSQNLQPRQTSIHVYRDSGLVMNAFLVGFGKSTSGLWQWPGSGTNSRFNGNLLGFRRDGEVHLAQGPRRTCSGFGPHLLSHELLAAQQIGQGDPQHTQDPAWWGYVDNYYASEMFALESQRTP